MPVLPRLNNYDDVYRQFRWNVPARYNIGVDVCDRWAALEPGRLAILHVRPDGRDDAISYGWLRETSNRLANVLRAHGKSLNSSGHSQAAASSADRLRLSMLLKRTKPRASR